MIIAAALSVWLAQTPHLKRRTDTPAHFSALTVETLLKARQEKFPVGAAGRITGYVTQRSHEADGDWHLGIGSSAHGTRATSVVCEVTPNFRPQPTVPKLGDRVSVSGWLFWDGHHKHEPGRGTCWEIHPVTTTKEVE